MKKRLLIPAVPAVACLAIAVPAALARPHRSAASSASAKTSHVIAATEVAASENWAGYMVTPNDGSGFSAVSGQWRTPKVSCTANSQPTYSAYWVGLGGGSERSQALEQIGTQADCSTTGTASYYAWYELVPSAPVKLSLKVHAGDRISARTAVSGDRVTLAISDLTTGRRWERTLTMTAATPDTSTAEWIVEAPSECTGDTLANCTPLALANFGTARFSTARVTSGGVTGSISNSRWTATAIELAPSSGQSFGGGPGGYFPGQGYSGYGGGYSTQTSYTSSEGAAPTGLSSSGGSFSVKYGAQLSTTGSSGSGESQGGGTDPYGGYGGGYGNGTYSYGGGYGTYSYGGGYGTYSYGGGYGTYSYGGGYGNYSYGGGYGGWAGSYGGGWGY